MPTKVADYFRALRALAILPLFAVAARAADIAPNLPPEIAAGCALAWHDEFDGDKLNTADWTIRTGDRFASRNLSANVSVADGALRLALKKEKAGELEFRRQTRRRHARHQLSARRREHLAHDRRLGKTAVGAATQNRRHRTPRVRRFRLRALF